MYLTGIDGVVDSNPELSFDYFLKGANKGDAQCQCNLGIIIYVELLYSTQICLFFNVYIFITGVLLLQGTGCAKDEKRAYEMFNESAEQGNTDAQFNLGIYFSFLSFTLYIVY